MCQRWSAPAGGRAAPRELGVVGAGAALRLGLGDRLALGVVEPVGDLVPGALHLLLHVLDPVLHLVGRPAHGIARALHRRLDGAADIDSEAHWGVLREAQGMRIISLSFKRLLWSRWPYLHRHEISQEAQRVSPRLQSLTK